MLSEGVNVLLEALHPHGQSLSHLRAFSLNLTDTGLGDASVSFLAALLFASHEAPANVSLHLQNNALSHSGLVYLLIDGLGDTAQRPIQWRCLTLDVGDNQIHLTVTGFGSPAPPPKKKKNLQRKPVLACTVPEILAFRAAMWLLLRRADMPHLHTLDLCLTNNHLSARSQVNGFPDGHCPRGGPGRIPSVSLDPPLCATSHTGHPELLPVRKQHRCGPGDL